MALLRSGNGTAKQGAITQPNDVCAHAQIAWVEISGPGGPPNNWLKTLRDDLAVFQSTEGSTQESPRQFGVEIYRSMQQIRRASGTGGSSKQPNDSRPGVT